jgi:O-antigen ligase
MIKLFETQPVIQWNHLPFSYAYLQGTLVPRLARLILTALTAFVFFSGAYRFLIFVSPLLLYSFYFTLLICVGICLYGEKQVNHRLKAFSPYLAWTLFFFLWGTTFSGYKDLVIPTVIRVVGTTLLVLSTLGVMLVDRAVLIRFSKLVQIAAILNAAISIWEMSNSDLITQIALQLNNEATAFNELRPGALWSNPDEAAYAFVFAIILSLWIKGPVAWAGRFAAVTGIVLSASRSGALALILCLGLYFIFKFRLALFSSGRLAMLINSLAVLAGIAWMVSFTSFSFELDYSDNWTLSRIFDFTESTYDKGVRTEVTTQALDKALENLWIGNGVLSFQDERQPYSALATGAHNIYLVSLGETGILGLLFFLGVLGIGLRRLIKTKLAAPDRAILVALWLAYLSIGFFWHNQFTSVAGALYLGLPYYLPGMLSQQNQPAVAAAL